MLAEPFLSRFAPAHHNCRRGPWGACEAPPRPGPPPHNYHRTGWAAAMPPMLAEPSFARPVPMATTPCSSAAARTRTVSLLAVPGVFDKYKK